MKAQVTIETITPETAQAYLTCQIDGQRNIRESHVSDLAINMKRGSFRLSPDCITVVKGQLANGQHRLSAVIKAGVPCDFLVMRTDDEELFKVIDSGAKRSVADCIVGVENSRNVASAAQLILFYDRGLLSTGAGFHGNVSSKSITRTELLDFIRKNSEQLSQDVGFCGRLYYDAKLIPPTMTAALLFIARRTRNVATINAFITSVYTGRTTDDAAFDLRARLMRDMNARGMQYRGYRFALLIKAFNAFALGIRPKIIRMQDGEAFPVIA